MNPLPIFLAHVGCGTDRARCAMLEHVLAVLEPLPDVTVTVQVERDRPHRAYGRHHGAFMDPVLPPAPASQRARRSLAVADAKASGCPLVAIGDDDLAPMPTTLDGVPWGAAVRTFFDAHPNVSQVAPYPLPDPVCHPNPTLDAMDATVGGFRIVRVADVPDPSTWPTAGEPGPHQYDAPFGDLLRGRSVYLPRWWGLHLGFTYPKPGGKYWRDGFAPRAG